MINVSHIDILIMHFQVLLICLQEFVLANIKDDIGNIPYENPASPIGLPEMPRDGDYGNIPYEKVSVIIEDYGKIPYDEVTKKPRGEDYGNIPYEKVVPGDGNQTMDIPGIIQDIFKGRDVPGLTLTTKTEQTSTPKILSTALTTVETTPEIKIRAKTTDDLAEYQSPGTIDDSDCNPAKQKCSSCRDKVGYRVYCLNGTTTPAPTDLQMVLQLLVKITEIYWSNNGLLSMKRFNSSVFKAYKNGWPVCPTTTSTTETPSPTWPPHKNTGRLIAKCFVCGMFEPGIPEGDHLCSDSFLSHSYRKHCKFLNRDGWHVNGTRGFYMWGHWTGGCSIRYTDVSTVYHQRTCRNNVTPALGSHYVSRRMARLEYALRREKDACLASPTASLVPLSRGISLYSRFHVCVCSKNYCNRAERLPAVLQWYTVAFVFAYGSVWLYDAIVRKVTF